MTRSRHRLLVGLFAATWVLVVACVAAPALGLGEQSATRDWVYGIVLLLALACCAWRIARFAQGRLPWALLTVAILLLVAAQATWSAADGDRGSAAGFANAAFSLGVYPVAFAAIVLLARREIAGLSARVWVDAAVASLAAGALASLLADKVLLTSSTPVHPVKQLYLLGDVFLVVLIAGVFAVTRGRPGQTWLLAAGALLLTAVADAYWILGGGGDGADAGALADSLGLIALLLVAHAACQPPTVRPTRVQEQQLLLVAGVLALAVLGVLTYAVVDHVSAATVALALTALIAAFARAALAFRENLRMLAQIGRQARTDPLTGLGNRRKLVDDLARALPCTTLAEPRMLVLYDLDGFKEYNDSFGHPAGDRMLARLGTKLAAAAAPTGSSYRLGGDEFCVLASLGEAPAERVVERTTSALSEKGEGFSLRCSFGAVFLPEEATAAGDALRLADERLYREKQRRRNPREPRALVRQALRDAGLHEHGEAVARLAHHLGTVLGLAPAELTELRRAAELHDIGKIAIPEEILGKSGPLSASERALFHEHPLIGERILRLVPAYRDTARLVRSTHERWDGAGYPDELEAEQIPLLARIITICDAYVAMTSDRPYQAARSHEEALAEIERCSGTHFDPQIAAAFVAHPADPTAAERLGGEDVMVHEHALEESRDHAPRRHGEMRHVAAGHGRR
jgi:diguanylate cyclase (GGDEF)-like protein